MNKISLQYIVYPLIVLGIYLINMVFSWPFLLIIMAVFLLFAVIQAVHYAEIISKNIGEPFGALVLALSVTLIELAIILSLMINKKEDSTTVARDTVFAAVMIILSGLIGLSIFLGALKHKTQIFNLQGTSSTLSVLVVVSVITFILPNYTVSVSGPFYTKSQLIFISIITFLSYVGFVFLQNYKLKKDFISENSENKEWDVISPFHNKIILNFILLVIYLISIVAYSSKLTPLLENYITEIGAPSQLTGITIAFVILLPEGVSAVKYARRNELQTSINLTLGSALATIGLTIPAVSLVSIYLNIPLTLGISNESIAMFLLSILVLIMTLSTGRTSFFQGFLLLLLFLIYIFLTIIP
jgi:Ca2+:H+ antiporter